MPILNNEKSKDIEEMLKAGVHYGYSRSSRHPNAKDFIFAIRNNIEIFDLEKVSQKLGEAKEFIKNLGKEKKKIVFVGTKIEARKSIEDTAKGLGMPYVSQRWLGGFLTNFKSMKKRMEYFEDLAKKKETGELEKYTKKERMLIEKDFQKLKKFFDSLKSLNGLPQAMVIIDPCEERISAEEAKKNSVPVVALVNSDCNPKSVDYPVPGNDSSSSSIDYFLKEISSAYKEGEKLAI
ncbi:MAG: 30S ribosomal protein S2 [Patescibacteria group bacterium]